MKKFIFLFLFFIFASLTVAAENINPNTFMEEYSSNIQKTVKSNLRYRGEENATVTVSYYVNSDGSIEDIQLEQKSGTGFDDAVIQAVKKSSPFKPFPTDLNISSVKITSQFQHSVYKYQAPVNQSINSEPYVRLGITPVEPPEEAKKAYNDYTRKISKYLFDRIPSTYSYIPKEPILKCIIQKDGTLKNVSLERTSGIEDYDKKIIETYSNLRVPPFPAELSKYFEEIPYSATMLRQFRSSPSFNTSGFSFR